MKKRLQSRAHPRVRYLTKIALLMKMAFVLILITCLQVSATGYSQEARLTLDLKQVTIGKVLKTIESQTSYKFVYSSDLFPANALVNIAVKETPVSDIMRLVLDKTGFTFKKIEDLIVITSATEEAIAREIHGRVVASATGEPLAGVTVTVDKTGVATATDSKGEFTIRLPDNGNANLVFSSVGFITQKVPVGNHTTLDIVLHESSKDLNSIVVVGYGSRKKKDLSSAVSEIGATEIEKSTAISPELAMKGQMAGVNVTSGGGDPTARPTVRIRGVSTFNFADPLYVVDGIPIAEGGAGATVDAVNDPTRRTPVNIYTIVNPDDIASITVLKDAAAAAVYGVRAGNGVILITTKSGKKGPVHVDVNTLNGTQKVPKTFKVLNTQQYASFYQNAYEAYPSLSTGGAALPIGQSPNFGPFFDPSSPQYLGNSATYDWQKAVINQHAQIQNYDVRVSGASDNTSYNFSAGYSDNDGPIVGSNVQRYSISTNVNAKVGKYVETGINLRLIQENIIGSQGSGGNDLSAYAAPPWQPIYDKSNKYGYAPLYSLNAPITPTTFNYSNLYGETYTMYQNVLGYLATSNQTYKNQSAIGSGYVQLQPITGLRIKGTLSAQQYAINGTGYTSFDNWEFGQTPANPYSSVPNPNAATTPNGLGISTATTTNIVKALNVDYQHDFGKHHIDLTADASNQEWTWITTGVHSFVFSSDPALRYFNAQGTEQGSYQENQHRVYVGYLGRLSYNYDGKYYLEGVVRRDGSSAFAPGHQYGTFPSASAGWRISRESFMKTVTFINDLKIRGSYGSLGNDQTTGGWQYLSVANVNPPSYNLGGSTPQLNNVGTAFGNFANTSLTWEKVKSGNIGFDATFLNDFSVTMDWYHKVTNGIIQNTSLTPSSGIQLPANINIAKVLNRGFELQVSYNKNIGEVGISVSANASTVHNEVLALNGGSAIRNSGYNGGQNVQVGLPIGFIYGYKVGGIFQNQAQIDKYDLSTTDKTSVQQKPGDLWFQNLYGQPKAGSTAQNPVKDSVVDANDQTNIGSTIPKYTYGFTLSANYKGFDISVFFLGVADVKKYNNVRAAAEGMNSNGRNQWTTVLNAWTPSHTNTNIPRAVYQDPNGNTRVSDRFVESAAFFRLGSLQLGYNLPKKWMNQTHVFQGLRLFVQGINLFTVTKYTGLDPENDTNPSTRQFLAGVRASF